MNYKKLLKNTKKLVRSLTTDSSSSNESCESLLTEGAELLRNVEDPTSTSKIQKKPTQSSAPSGLFRNQPQHHGSETVDVPNAGDINKVAQSNDTNRDVQSTDVEPTVKETATPSHPHNEQSEIEPSDSIVLRAKKRRSVGETNTPLRKSQRFKSIGQPIDLPDTQTGHPNNQSPPTSTVRGKDETEQVFERRNRFIATKTKPKAKSTETGLGAARYSHGINTLPKPEMGQQCDPWLEAKFTVYEGNIENLKQRKAPKIEFFNEEFTLWSIVCQRLALQYGRSYYFDPRFWGTYFGAAKPPLSTRSQLSKSVDTMKKTISASWKNLLPDKNGQLRSYFMVTSTIKIPTAVQHSAVLVVVKQKENLQYYYYETMADRPSDTYCPMNFATNFGGMTQMDNLRIIFGSQTTTNDCYKRCVNFVDRTASGAETLSASDLYNMKELSRGQASLLFKQE